MTTSVMQSPHMVQAITNIVDILVRSTQYLSAVCDTAGIELSNPHLGATVK